MITSVIIDDESKGRLALRQKLIDYCLDVAIVGEAANGEDGLKLIEELQPNLVFLDIEMPKLNGFEMLNQLKEKNFHLIFTTAYDHYAIKAIKYSAFDYLLKPIDIEELKSAINKIVNLKVQNLQPQVDLLHHNLGQNSMKLHKLAIPTLDGLYFYDTSNIIHLDASSNYTNLYFVDGKKIVASKTLKDFEELLPEESFFRPHNSFIINVKHVTKYIKGNGGQIEMSNGKMIDLSRRKKDEFL